MRLFLSSSFNLLPCLLFGLFLPQMVFAQTVQTDEYIYIGIEAEDHTQKNERWVTTTPTTPASENDPDGNHSDQASGSTYLELLPDVRVTHEDTFGPPQAFWGQAGKGPDAHYQVNFPEPGRYYVHVRAYSTGTEDNGIHVGIDGTWPDSGRTMQFCTASRRAWWWSSAQRDSGGNGSCGIEKSIWLDVDTAGAHTVSFSAREDGFEIDRFALIKDLSNNTRICSPQNISVVSCRNGSIESADGFVDLRARLTAVAADAGPDVEPPNPLQIRQGEEITLTAAIENLDGFDTATDVVFTLSPVAGGWQTTAADNRCVEEGSEFKCTLNQLHPTAPGENEPFVFTMRAIDEGNLHIDASILGAEIDDAPENDATTTVVNVLPAAPGDLQLNLNADDSTVITGETIQINVAINNVGQFAVYNVSFNMAVPAGLTVEPNSLPAACSSGTKIECAYASINFADQQVFKVEMVASADGLHALNANVQASNDGNAANNADALSFSSITPVVETTTQGSTDSGDATGGTTGGSTTGTGSTDDSVATTTDGDTDGTTTESTDGTGDGTFVGASDGSTTGTTAASTDGATTSTADGSTTETTSSTTDGLTTDTTDEATAGASGGSTAGASEGSTDGASDGSSDGATATSDSASSDQQPVNDDSGAMAHWFLLLLVLLCSARLYGWHKRQSITIV